MGLIHLGLIGSSSGLLGSGSLITFPYPLVFLAKFMFQRAAFSFYTLLALISCFCTVVRVSCVSVASFHSGLRKNGYLNESISAGAWTESTAMCLHGWETQGVCTW